MEEKEVLLQEIEEAVADWPPLLSREYIRPPAVAHGERDAKSEVVGDGSCERTNKATRTTVSVLQFNLLADGLSGRRDDKGGFDLAPHQCLEWDKRKFRLLHEALRSRCDVLCLQELDHFEDFFAPQLRRAGYDGLYKTKLYSPGLERPDEGGKEAAKSLTPDGCALFYDKSKFDLAWSENLRFYSSRPEGEMGSKHSQGESSSNQLSLEKDVAIAVAENIERQEDGRVNSSHNVWLHNQVAIVAQFEVRASPGFYITVAVTHLKSEKSVIGENIRLSQAKALTDYLTKKADGTPVILAGDFNASPSSTKYPALVYNLMRSHALGLESAYWNPATLEEPPFTTLKNRKSRGGMFKHTIDYIWYSKAVLKPLKVWSLPTADEIGQNGLPSYEYPSDHLALAAEFEAHSE